ncbi:MAG: HAD family hydrolase [Acidimicrobiales bacterium]
MNRFDLVIFDCDGVLVDSERLAVRTEVEILGSLGWPLTESQVIDRFVGRSAAYMQGEIEQYLGRPIDWESEYLQKTQQVFREELVPVDGIFEALDGIDIDVCVASSGTHEAIRFSLGLTGLLERFEGRIFSADDVEHGKPAPDLFFLAARTMGHEPSRCAVIEDSVSGVTAGLAAGMTVFAFTGSVTRRDQFPAGTDTVFDQMDQLPRLLG